MAATLHLILAAALLVLAFFFAGAFGVGTQDKSDRPKRKSLIILASHFAAYAIAALYLAYTAGVM